MLKCPSASRCQCREGRLHLDARCEQMQGTGLHLASRCEKMQVPEQFQATDALKKSSKAPQDCIFGCTKVLYATFDICGALLGISGSGHGLLCVFCLLFKPLSQRARAKMQTMQTSSVCCVCCCVVTLAFTLNRDLLLYHAKIKST